MYEELDLIVGERIRQAFRTADIPLGDLVLSRKTASDGPGDESWTVQVYVGREDVPKAIETLSGVFANLKMAGISDGAIVGSAMMWTCGLGTALLLAFGLELGLVGIWLGMAADEFYRSFANIWRWRSGRWKSKAVV